MSRVLVGSDNLDAIKSDGTVATAVLTGSSLGCTLDAGTWFFVLGRAESSSMSAQLKWAAAVAGTITIEICDFPVKVGGPAGTVDDVTDRSATAGDWMPLNPSTAHVPVVGTGNSATAAVVTAGGTNAGGCLFDIGITARRARIKLVLSTGGLVRCAFNAKE